MILSQVCFAVDQTIYPKKLIMDLLKKIYQSSKHHISRDLAFNFNPVESEITIENQFDHTIP